MSYLFLRLCLGASSPVPDGWGGVNTMVLSCNSPKARQKWKMRCWRGSNEGLVNQILIAADINSSRGCDVILLLCMKTSKDAINIRNIAINAVFVKKKKCWVWGDWNSSSLRFHFTHPLLELIDKRVVLSSSTNHKKALPTPSPPKKHHIPAATYSSS